MVRSIGVAFAYSAMMFIGVFIYMILYLLVRAWLIGDFSVDQATTDTMETGWPYLIACGLSFLLLTYLHRKQPIVWKRADAPQMTGKRFGQLLAVFMMGQLVFTALANLGESLANVLGYTILPEVEMASAGSPSLSMFFYASFVGPIFRRDGLPGDHHALFGQARPSLCDYNFGLFLRFNALEYHPVSFRLPHWPSARLCQLDLRALLGGGPPYREQLCLRRLTFPTVVAILASCPRWGQPSHFGGFLHSGGLGPLPAPGGD